MSLKGKAAIVTGAARGIGKQIAATLAESNADIVLVDVLPEEEITATAREIETTGARTLALRADVTSLEQMSAVAEKTVETFGNIHILINNAGITRDNLAMKMAVEDWDTVLAVNLKGAFVACKAVIRQMIKQRAGKIVNVASIVGVIGNPGQANYCASKAGIIGLTKSLAKELAPRNMKSRLNDSAAWKTSAAPCGSSAATTRPT